MNEFDYVVVGSGSAGGVIAARLSENQSISILLLEAGPSDRNPILHIPAAARYSFNARRYNWNEESEPEPNLNGRRLSQPHGRVLGGSSSTNGMIFLRGHALDYNGWEELGAVGWSYSDVLPYFQRLECMVNPTTPYQGRSGPILVSTASKRNPISNAFMEACAQAGYQYSKDINGYQQEGYGLFPMNAAKGFRSSISRCYLNPAKGRRNLTIQTSSVAQRIIFEGKRAIGIDYCHKGQMRKVRARREIILSAGAFNSPKLLLLSGVGPGDHLHDIGIEMVHDLPGVGENLMDHSITTIQLECRQPVSLYGKNNVVSKTLAALRWLAHRDGLLASNHFESGAFIRSAAGVKYPDIQLYLFPIAVAVGSKDFMRFHGFQIQISPQRSASRGRLRLRNSNPDKPLNIKFNYLEKEQDFIELRASIRLAREILDQPAMAPFLGREFLPGRDIQTDKEIDAYLRDSVESSYHPSGTCKMGTDPLAVVDPECRVHGVEGLRVADASIMPMITSCNLNCPTIMIGEKASDMIAGKPPLPKSDLPYYVDPEWRTRQRSSGDNIQEVYNVTNS